MSPLVKRARIVHRDENTVLEFKSASDLTVFEIMQPKRREGCPPDQFKNLREIFGDDFKTLLT